MAKSKKKTEAQQRERERSLGVDCPDLDPDGWMSERPNYWLDLPDPPLPTRAAWLRHRVAEAAAYFGMSLPTDSPSRVSEEDWIRLSEMALGPLPRPEKPARKRQTRPTVPDARQPARTPEAPSPHSAPRERSAP